MSNIPRQFSMKIYTQTNKEIATKLFNLWQNNALKYSTTHKIIEQETESYPWLSRTGEYYHFKKMKDSYNQSSNPEGLRKEANTILNASCNSDAFSFYTSDLSKESTIPLPSVLNSNDKNISVDHSGIATTLATTISSDSNPELKYLPELL